MTAIPFTYNAVAVGGGPASGALANVYVRNTTTRSPAYTNVGLTTPATNPVVADSDGRFSFYLNSDIDYDIRVTTSDGATRLLEITILDSFMSVTFLQVDQLDLFEKTATGDGTTTQFTLEDCVADNPYQINVTIDGLLQPKTSYTVTTDETDTLVTFSQAPPDDAIIWFTSATLQALSPVSAVDASSSTVLASGSSTARTLAARFGDQKTVLDFGAVGDCTAAETGTDDAAAIQLAFDWLVAGNNRKLLFPNGYRFRVGSTCTADWGGDGARGGQIIMESPITPDTGVGNAFEFIDVRYLAADLWVDGGGDTIVDYSTADPSGAQQAFLFRGVRNADLWVRGYDYDGRVVRVTEEGVGEEKTSRLIFHSFLTGESGSPCGQAIYVDATSACAMFASASWFYDLYGPYFYQTDDLFFGQLEGGLWVNTGMVIEGCQSVWAPVIALGEGDASVLLTIKGSSSPQYSANIWIGALFAQLVDKGVVLEDIGSDGDTPSITIGALYTRGNAEHGLYIDNCQRVDITHHSSSDLVSVETTGACSGKLHMTVLGSDEESLIIGATANNLVVSGNIKTPNSSSAATTDAVVVNSTGEAITFRDLHIESSLVRYAYNLVSGNKVRIDGGRLNLSGGAVAMGANLPLDIVGRVEGYKAGTFYVLASSGAALSHTGDTSKTALATIPIPAGAMGANGRLRITTHWTVTGSTNSKTTSYEYGGGVFFSVSTTTAATVGWREQREIVNRNSASSQVCLRASSLGTGTLTASTTTAAVNTASAQDLIFYATLTDSGETVTLEYYCVELLYAA